MKQPAVLPALAGTQAAFADAYETVVLTTGRRDRLDAAIAAMAGDSEFTPVVRRLSCLRGISTLTAFCLAVEIGDWDRFTGAGIGAYVALVPSEPSSGASRSQGGITKTGNGHVRRLLVEAAWHHRKPYRPTGLQRVLRRRWELAPPAAVARAQAGNHRLHRRWVFNGLESSELASMIFEPQHSLRSARLPIHRPVF